MKHEIAHPLSEAKVLKESLIKPGVTWDQYLAMLKLEAAKHNHQFELAVDQFAQWVQEDYDLVDSAGMNEEYIEKLREKVKQGEVLGLRGNPLSESTTRKTFTNIRSLHNWVQAAGKKPPKVLRSLVDGRLVNRFIFFNSLTAQTQKAIIIFGESGTKLPYDTQLMSGQTREEAIDSALLILRRLGLKGLEQITKEHVNSLTGKPDPNILEYRRISRSLHNASCLFRYCNRKCLLPSNPLENVNNSSFANYAVRDFLPPDQLEILLDIHGSKKGISVNVKNELSVRDWLVALLLVDLALRCSELASLTWCNIQHNRNSNGYSIRLGPENQKMGKPTIILPILYPPTNELLKRYAQIRGITIGQHSSAPLINDNKNLPASSGKIGDIVKEIAAKLGLQTYHQGVLSCHDLRRTFATCNAWPLGLGFQVHQLAERLRDSIAVVEKCYIVQNPLLQEAKMQPFMDKSQPKDKNEESLELIKILESLDPSHSDLLKPIRDAVARRASAKEEEKELGHIPSWIDESKAMSILNQTWNHMPRLRCLRKYFASRRALKRSGSHGMVYYDAVIARELSEKYEPVSDHINKVSRAISLALSGFDFISIGRIKLIKREQMGTFLKSVRGVDGKLSPYKTGKTELTKLAKQTLEKQASRQQYAAIA